MVRTVLILFCLICSSCSGTSFHKPASAYSEALISERAIAIELASGIKVRLGGLTPPDSWKVEYVHPFTNLNKDGEALMRYLNLILIEVNKYSQSLIDRSKIKSIAVVKNLLINGDHRSAMPDYVNEVLYLDFLNGNYSRVYQEHVFHHEFFHLLEQELNGSCYFKDPKWNKLNPEDFIYGKGGKYQRGENEYPLTHPKPGFINLYSTSAIEEDKAEIFAALFVGSERKKIFEMAKKDNYLADKIELMIDIVKEIDASLFDEMILHARSPVADHDE